MNTKELIVQTALKLFLSKDFNENTINESRNGKNFMPFKYKEKKMKKIATILTLLGFIACLSVFTVQLNANTCDEADGVYRESIDATGVSFEIYVYGSTITQWIEFDASGSYKLAAANQSEPEFWFDLDGPGDVGDGVVINTYHIEYWDGYGWYWTVSYTDQKNGGTSYTKYPGEASGGSGSVPTSGWHDFNDGDSDHRNFVAPSSISGGGTCTPLSDEVTFTNGANAALNFEQTNASPPEDNWLLGQFSLASDATGSTLNSVAVTLGGTYDSGDLQSTPFQLYAANSNSFGSASTLGSSVADPGSGSDVTFSSLSDALPSGTRYYWVTADVSATASGDDTINGTIAAADDLSITDGTLSGSSSYGKLNAGDDATLPVELSAFTAQVIESVPTLYWETQSETDNMGWFIYRNNENDFSSSDQVSDFIEGHGTTTQIQSYLYEDTIEDPVVGDVYYYWLESIDYSGLIHHYDKVAVLIIPDNGTSGNSGITKPERYGLLQNEPNPVISSTRISFNLTETAQVDLVICNLKGQLVKTLYSGIASKHTVVWDGKDKNGKQLENGVYFYKLVVNGKTEKTKKLILMK